MIKFFDGPFCSLKYINAYMKTLIGVATCYLSLKLEHLKHSCSQVKLNLVIREVT